MPTLKEQVRYVHLARRRAENARASVELSKSIWENDNKVLIADSKDAAEGVTVAEAALREMALQAYAADGNKAPAPGVGIRVMQRRATDHARALQLDRKRFGAIANVEDEEPSATIASDLAKFMEASDA